jgi:hypothetical protein
VAKNNPFHGGWDDRIHANRGKQPTRRQQIYEFICLYADGKNGPTPSIREVAQHFNLAYGTVYSNVMKLITEGRIVQEDGKLLVVGSEWIPPFPESSILPR